MDVFCECCDRLLWCPAPPHRGDTSTFTSRSSSDDRTDSPALFCSRHVIGVVLLRRARVWWCLSWVQRSLGRPRSALVMHATVSVLLKQCSAFAFMLTGLVKGRFHRCPGCQHLGDPGQQYMGFIV